MYSFDVEQFSIISALCDNLTATLITWKMASSVLLSITLISPQSSCNLGLGKIVYSSF